MRTQVESQTGPATKAVNTVEANSHVVHRGVRHVAIDILPRDVLTFRTICGRDVIDEPRPNGEPTDCKWCRRFAGMAEA